MSKTNTNSGTSKGSSAKPASTPSASAKPNPNYPSTTGNKSGGNRGNTPKR